jgi:hypothetical protein
LDEEAFDFGAVARYVAASGSRHFGTPTISTD